MSIVLVVIGLIVGGVLVGRGLIEAATVRQQITQLDQVETAIRAFQDKYAALPGDMPNATAIFGSTDANGYTVANGNGDGNILSTDPYSTAGNCLSGFATEFRNALPPNEVEEVFHHLELAGLVGYNIAPPAQYASSGLTNLPTAVFGGGMMVSCITASGQVQSSAFQSGTGILIGMAGAASNAWYSTRIWYDVGAAATGPLVITSDEAAMLDTKVDDGQPLTGQVGVLFNCSGDEYGIPSTYQAMTSTCNVSMVKMLWH